MSTPVPPGGDDVHEILGALVRQGLVHRSPSDPVPLVPAGLRAAFERRRHVRPWPALVGGALATAAVAAVVIAAGWYPGRALGYVVEHEPGETRVRFGDGSMVTAESGAKLQVMACHRAGADLRLEDGAAHFRLRGGARPRWSIAAGPYTWRAGATDLDVSWSADRGTLSGAVGKGAASVRGPGREAQLASGQAVVARVSDGFWRISGGARVAVDRRVAVDVAVSPPSGARCRQAEAGPPVATGPASAGVPWVWLDRGGCLGYAQDARGNRVPDFSHAGYRGGGVPLPLVPRAVSVTPGNGKDDTAAVQRAIDSVAALPPDGNGFRGAVELGAGTFTLAGSLRVDASGVVLRGQGSEGTQATVLRGVGTARALVAVGPEANRTLDRAAHRIVDPYVPVGATTFELDAVDGLHVGDEIAVRRPFSARLLAAMGAEGGRHRGGEDPGLVFERRIVAVDGPRVTVDVPLTEALDAAYAEATVSRYSFPERIGEVGVERIAGKADFDPTSDLGDGILIEVVAAQDVWVRQVKADGFESGAVSLEHPSKAVTVVDTTYVAPSHDADDWSRAFVIGGQQNLLLRCRSVGAQHALGTWPRASGPNVVLELTAVGRASVAAPARWTSGLLLDGVRFVDDGAGEPAGEILMSYRDGGRGRGWAATSSVLWNTSARRFLIDSPPGAQNWVFGTAAPETFGSATFDAAPVARPDSLYRAQLAERLGDAALAALAR